MEAKSPWSESRYMVGVSFSVVFSVFTNITIHLGGCSVELAKPLIHLGLCCTLAFSHCEVDFAVAASDMLTQNSSEPPETLLLHLGQTVHFTGQGSHLHLTEPEERPVCQSLTGCCTNGKEKSLSSSHAALLAPPRSADRNKDRNLPPPAMRTPRMSASALG